MVEDIHYPLSLSSRDLDVYLANGWYRMHQSMFTTRYVFGSETIYPVFWLRISLSNLPLRKSHRNILKINRFFSVEIKTLSFNTELELLYQDYAAQLSFQSTETLLQLLYGSSAHNIFDTQVILIRDHGKLIAAGIFDCGEGSIAGIVNFYDPAYARFSLGKYLMLLKKEYAVSQSKTYYYPGYFSTINPKFDYKLFLAGDESEVLLTDMNRWVPLGDAKNKGYLNARSRK